MTSFSFSHSQPVASEVRQNSSYPGISGPTFPQVHRGREAEKRICRDVVGQAAVVGSLTLGTRTQMSGPLGVQAWLPCWSEFRKLSCVTFSSPYYGRYGIFFPK